MSKPKGWTYAMLAKRDRIAKALIRGGMSEFSAYAIATHKVKKG